ncbi:MAG: sulfotransferase family protein, partial [Acidobacteriaceae bacterium]
HPRGAEAWYDSTIDTIYFTETLWQFKVLEWLTPFGRKLGELSHKLLWGRTLKGVMGDKAKAVARYNAYIDEVKAAVPPEQLLVFSVADGWGSLCRFLGVPEPQEPFPQLNDRESIKKTIRQVMLGSYMTIAACVAVTAACLAGIWWAFK